MIKYKVLFENNKAIAAEAADVDTGRHLMIVKEGDRLVIQWFIVWGDDADDAIRMADRVVNGNFTKFL
jgi:hypothetical protein